MERHLRALLRDVLCGYLDPDLRRVADELLLDQPEPFEIRAASLKPEPPPRAAAIRPGASRCSWRDSSAWTTRSTGPLPYRATTCPKGPSAACPIGQICGWPPSPTDHGESTPFGQEEMARTLAFLFLAGGRPCCSSLAARHAPDTDARGRGGHRPPWRWSWARCCWPSGSRLPVGRGRLPGLGTDGDHLASSTSTAAAASTRAFYLWVGAEAFLFLDRRGIALQIGLMAVRLRAGRCTATGDRRRAGSTGCVVLGATVALGLLVGYLRLRAGARCWTG